MLLLVNASLLTLQELAAEQPPTICQPDIFQVTNAFCIIVSRMQYILGYSNCMSQTQ